MIRSGYLESVGTYYYYKTVQKDRALKQLDKALFKHLAKELGEKDLIIKEHGEIEGYNLWMKKHNLPWRKEVSIIDSLLMDIPDAKSISDLLPITFDGRAKPGKFSLAKRIRSSKMKFFSGASRSLPPTKNPLEVANMLKPPTKVTSSLPLYETFHIRHIKKEESVKEYKAYLAADLGNIRDRLIQDAKSDVRERLQNKQGVDVKSDYAEWFVLYQCKKLSYREIQEALAEIGRHYEPSSIRHGVQTFAQVAEITLRQAAKGGRPKNQT